MRACIYGGANLGHILPALERQLGYFIHIRGSTLLPFDSENPAAVLQCLGSNPYHLTSSFDASATRREARY